jgi:UDP-N-acetylmuramoylalanine--D-glutamate ligase
MQNKKFGILGLGISGIATVKFLLKQKLQFIAWDDSSDSRKKCESLLKEHKNSSQIVTKDNEAWQNIDYLVLSPGVPLYFPTPHPLVALAKKHQIKIICDLELFYLIYPNHTYIGITGTNGKSTTAALVHHILHTNNIPAKLVGNIGTPILSIEPSKDDIMVIEASSYQLDLIEKLKFNIAILLNITEDHLDRHGTMANYISAKCNIFKNQTKKELAIINFDNPITKKIFTAITERKIHTIPISTKSKLSKGISMLDDKIYDNINHNELAIEQNKSLLGTHNFENIVASYSAINSLKKINSSQIKEAINSYQGLDHRMQYLGMVNNMEFINDSKATNAESTENALKVFDNIYWIVGGLPKAGGITSLHPFFNKIRHAFIIGDAEKAFAKIFDKHSVQYTVAGSLDKAFELATNTASQDKGKKIKTILLSPACASFDQWKNFEERGCFFFNLAKKYIKK